MIKKILIALFLSMPLWSLAQNMNPFVAQGVVSPAPLDNLASNGTGVVSFLVGNTGDDPLPLVANQEMLLVITLSRGVPNAVDPIAAVGGTMASYFDWIYDAMTLSYLGTQNQVIPDAFSGGVGTIEILYKVTSNSLETNPQNGFNVNLTPPAYTNGINSLNDDQVSSYTWTVPKTNTLPDMNATFVDSTVAGKVNTNDNVLAGTTYGTPAPFSSNPSPSTIVMQSDGSYLFSAPAVGVYKFFVPVCPLGQSTNCPLELLTITVTDPTVNTNPPTANVDEGTTYGQTPITLNTLGNDACNNANCNLAPGSVTIEVQPKNGSVTVDPLTGQTTYIANTGFYGLDSLTYSVCDSTSNPVKCVSAIQYINVLPSGSANRIDLNDDYKVIPFNSTANGNAVTNDHDPETNTITISPQNTTIPGKGTLILNGNGTFTFTPVNNYVGTVEVPYNACDNGSPVACSRATIYITITPPANPLPALIGKISMVNLGCLANIQWTTLQESNLSHFEIQKLSNSTYEAIGRVNAIGNSPTSNAYEFTDKNTTEGANVYRLKIVDIDGHFVYSDENSIMIHCAGVDISLYPNPVTSSANVLIQSESDESFELRLMDVSGRTIYTSSVDVNHDKKVISIPMHSLAAGIYTLRITNGIDIRVFRLEKISK